MGGGNARPRRPHHQRRQAGRDDRRAPGRPGRLRRGHGGRAAGRWRRAQLRARIAARAAHARPHRGQRVLLLGTQVGGRGRNSYGADGAAAGPRNAARPAPGRAPCLHRRHAADRRLRAHRLPKRLGRAAVRQHHAGAVRAAQRHHRLARPRLQRAHPIDHRAGKGHQPAHRRQVARRLRGADGAAGLAQAPAYRRSRAGQPALGPGRARARRRARRWPHARRRLRG